MKNTQAIIEIIKRNPSGFWNDLDLIKEAMATFEPDAYCATITADIHFVAAEVKPNYNPYQLAVLAMWCGVLRERKEWEAREARRIKQEGGES